MKTMTKLEHLEQVAEILEQHDNFAILTHRFPDGDTLGSAYALCGMLQQKGKKAKVLFNGKLLPEYHFLDDSVEHPDFQAETFVSVDVAEEKLLGELAQYKDNILLAVDHHETHCPFAEYYYVEPDSASAGEIIFELAKVMNIDFTKSVSNAIYTAVSTDTGCFRYSNVTVRTHLIAAELIQYGCENYKIDKAMFDTVPKNKKQLEAYILTNMEYYHNDEIALIYLSQATLDTFGFDNETVGSTSYITRTIAGVKVGITVRELDGTTFKISVRTNDGVSASKICNQFHGGGHDAAAGCTINAPDIRTAKQKLLAVVETYL